MQENLILDRTVIYPTEDEFFRVRKGERLYAYLLLRANDEGIVLKEGLPISKIRRDLGYKGRSAIYKQIEALEAAGYIKSEPGRYIIEEVQKYVELDADVIQKILSEARPGSLNAYAYLVYRFDYYKRSGHTHFMFSQNQLLKNVYFLVNQGANHTKPREAVEYLVDNKIIFVEDKKRPINGGFYFAMYAHR